MEFDNFDYGPGLAVPGAVVYIDEHPYTLGTKWFAGTDTFNLQEDPTRVIKVRADKGESVLHMVASERDLSPPVYGYNKYALVMKKCSGPSYADILRPGLVPRAKLDEIRMIYNGEKIDSVIDSLVDTAKKAGYVPPSSIRQDSIVWDDAAKIFYIVDWKNWSTQWAVFLKGQQAIIRDVVQNWKFDDMRAQVDKWLLELGRVQLIEWQLPHYSKRVLPFAIYQRQQLRANKCVMFMVMIRRYFAMYDAGIYLNQLMDALGYIERLFEFEAKEPDIIDIPTVDFTMAENFAYKICRYLATRKENDVREKAVGARARITELARKHGIARTVRTARAMLEP